MIGSFSIDGYESSNYNLVCKSVKRPLLPAMKVRRVDMSGLSGAYDFDDDEYSLRTITMRIAYIGTSFEELRSRARDIAAWLYTSTWKELVINDEPDKYYLAKITSEVDLKSLWESGTADVTFDCQPFALSSETSETRDVTGNTSYTLTAEGTRHINYKSPPGSKFQVIIIGSFTTLDLTINGNTLSFTDAMVSKTLIIDSVEMTVDINSASVFGDVTGDISKFFQLNPGSNSISISGTGMDFNIGIYYKPLWL
jgi:predicted phage tail component-like protein